LSKLSPGELKRYSQRARKLFDKWEGLRRSQSRTKVRKTGKAESPANTKLKVQIFREALAKFDSRLSALEQAAAPKASAESQRKRRRTASSKPASQSRLKKSTPKKAARAAASPPKKGQKSAKAAAKQARVDRTGLTSRVLGHVSARGRRAQAARDKRN
jgi:hypothetical protein